MSSKLLKIGLKIISAFQLLTTKATNAKIIGAVILPHGDFVYAPNLIDGTNGSQELHDAAASMGRQWQNRDIDVIFMTTPHGFELTDTYLMYRNSKVAGTAILGSDVIIDDDDDVMSPPVVVDVSLNATISDEIVDDIMRSFSSHSSRNRGWKDSRRYRNLIGPSSHVDNSYRVESMTAFADSQPMEINWGEIVPLSFLRKNTTKNCHKTSCNNNDKGNDPLLPPVVIISIPTRRYDNGGVDMIPELLSLGSHIGSVLENSNKKILWLVSSDLAHTHSQDGPYGYCDCAERFDTAVGAWVESAAGGVAGGSLDRDKLLVDGAREQELGAQSCGFTGLVMLQGMMDEVGGDKEGEWRGMVMANYHPTYYGMMVAQFLREGYISMT